MFPNFERYLKTPLKYIFFVSLFYIFNKGKNSITFKDRNNKKSHDRYNLPYKRQDN